MTFILGVVQVICRHEEAGIARRDGGRPAPILSVGFLRTTAMGQS